MATRMLDCLAAVARETRHAAGLRQIDIATAAGVSHTIISRFERAVLWPDRLEEIIAAYATETDREPVDLWAMAVDRWRTGG